MKSWKDKKNVHCVENSTKLCQRNIIIKFPAYETFYKEGTLRKRREMKKPSDRQRVLLNL